MINTSMIVQDSLHPLFAARNGVIFDLFRGFRWYYLSNGVEGRRLAELTNSFRMLNR